MATVNYTLRIDERDKTNAEKVFKELGMTFSTGINIYIKTIGRQQRIPFELAISDPKSFNDGKWEEFISLQGCLAGHEVDLSKEREDRILSR